MGTIFMERRKSPHIKYIFGHLGFRWSFGIFKVLINLGCPHSWRIVSWRVVISTRKKSSNKIPKFSQMYLCSQTKIFTNFSKQEKLLQKIPKFVPKTHVYFLQKIGLGMWKMRKENPNGG
jgi:hypothetical protein